jgi:hypothetical protein
VSGEIAWRREDDVAQSSQPPGFKARVGKFAGPDGEIEALTDEIEV